MKFFRVLCRPNQNITICCSLQPGFYKHSLPLHQSMIYLGVIWRLHLETKITAGESVEWWGSKSPLESGWSHSCYQEVTACGENSRSLSPVQTPACIRVQKKSPQGKEPPKPLFLDQEQCAREIGWKGWEAKFTTVTTSLIHWNPISMEPSRILQGMGDPKRNKVNTLLT